LLVTIWQLFVFSAICRSICSLYLLTYCSLATNAYALLVGQGEWQVACKESNSCSTQRFSIGDFLGKPYPWWAWRYWL